MADALDSKSSIREGVWVRVPPPAHHFMMFTTKLKTPFSNWLYSIPWANEQLRHIRKTAC